MLKKLIKHDLKYGVRTFAVLHIILIMTFQQILKNLLLLSPF